MNVRSMKSRESMIELENAFEKSDFDIIGISEVRREGNTTIITKKGNMLSYIGTGDGQKGVGFIIKPEWAKRVVEFRGISDRIAILRVEVGEKKQLTIIQIYAPTSVADKEIVGKFFDQLTDIIQENKINDKKRLIVMGDFNSQVGQQREGEEAVIGGNNYGKRNERGEELIKFCMENELKIVNTIFKKRKERRWTWLAPNQNHKSQ